METTKLLPGLAEKRRPKIKQAILLTAAVLTLMLSVSAFPATAQQIGLIDLARELVRHKQWDSAVPRLLSILAKDPKHQEARLLLATAFFHTGAQVESHQLLSELIEEGYQIDQVLVLRGRIRVAILDYEGALKDFTQALARNNRLEKQTIGFDLAVALRHTGKCKEALALVKVLFENDSAKFKANPDYYRFLSGCQMSLGDFVGARAVARLGLNVGVFDNWLLDDMGWAEIAQGRKVAAINTFMSVLSRQLSKMKKVPPVRLGLPFNGPMRVLRGAGSAPLHQSMRNYFSWDLQLLGKFDRAYRTNGLKAEDFYCFGQPVFSPVAGWVVDFVNNRPDNPVNKPNWTHPDGNHVRIWVSSGMSVIVSHLRRGSVKVRKKQQLAVGDEIGACGNSGSADVPHVQLSARSGLDENAKSVPVLFDGFVQRFGARLEKKSDAVPDQEALVEPCAACIKPVKAEPAGGKTAGKAGGKDAADTARTVPTTANTPKVRSNILVPAKRFGEDRTPLKTPGDTPGVRQPRAIENTKGKTFQWGSNVDSVGGRIKSTAPSGGQ